MGLACGQRHGAYHGSYSRLLGDLLANISYFTLRRKEKLWPHTREFADRAIAHVSNMLKKLQEVGEPCSLYTVRPYPSLACFAPLFGNAKGKRFIFPFDFLSSVPGVAELA